MTLTGKPGQTVTLHYNERLNPDGTLSDINGEFALGPFQRDIFILSGAKNEVFEARSTYHGFRYIEIEGLDSKPVLDSVIGQFVHTDPEPVGQSSCSNYLVNSIHEISLRTLHCNMHSIPIDCSHREKAGWLQDGCVAQEAAIFNMSPVPDYGYLVAEYSSFNSNLMYLIIFKCCLFTRGITV
jgi:alpha-L-rhamnosidase